MFEASQSTLGWTGPYSFLLCPWLLAKRAWQALQHVSVFVGCGLTTWSMPQDSQTSFQPETLWSFVAHSRHDQALDRVSTIHVLQNILSQGLQTRTTSWRILPLAQPLIFRLHLNTQECIKQLDFAKWKEVEKWAGRPLSNLVKSCETVNSWRRPSNPADAGPTAERFVPQAVSLMPILLYIAIIY